MGKQQKTGLFFGSFNPIHIGHLVLANYMVEFTDITELWFVVSPQNPFKGDSTLLNGEHRLNMVESAVGKSNKYKVSDIEFHLPTPSYTYDTLKTLSDKYQDKNFVILMGADSAKHFHHWKYYDLIMSHFERYIYPRPNVRLPDEKEMINVSVVHGPLIEMSSSFIRKAISEGKDVQFFLPHSVYRYINSHNLYFITS